MTDNAYADIMMEAAWAVQRSPSDARARLIRARDRLSSIRGRLYTVRSSLCDADKVRSGARTDLADLVAALESAEQEAWVAATAYTAAIGSLRYCCLAAGFGRQQTDVWVMYYGYGHSMGSIARLTGLTKSSVQHMLTGVRPSRDFCLGIARIADADVI